jgi:hypothetical protein
MHHRPYDPASVGLRAAGSYTPITGRSDTPYFPSPHIVGQQPVYEASMDPMNGNRLSPHGLPPPIGAYAAHQQTHYASPTNSAHDIDGRSIILRIGAESWNGRRSAVVHTPLGPPPTLGRSQSSYETYRTEPHMVGNGSGLELSSARDHSGTPLTPPKRLFADVPSSPKTFQSPTSPSSAKKTLPPQRAAGSDPFSAEATRCMNSRELSPPTDPAATQAAQTFLCVLEPEALEIRTVPLTTEQTVTDPATLNARRKQIHIGKSQPEYARYKLLVPESQRQARNPAHPLTPRITYKVACRRWKMIMHAWRRSLHIFADPTIEHHVRGQPANAYDPSAYNRTVTPNAPAGDDRTTATPEHADGAASELLPSVAVTNLDHDAELDAATQGEADHYRPSTPKSQIPTQAPLFRPTPVKAGGRSGCSTVPSSPQPPRITAAPTPPPVGALWKA